MDRYVLKTRLGEKIAYTKAFDLIEAHANFSKIKDLEVKVLLELFVVDIDIED